MNTNNADNNEKAQKKAVSAKSLLRKLNADLGETNSRLEELAGSQNARKSGSGKTPEPYAAAGASGAGADFITDKSRRADAAAPEKPARPETRQSDKNPISESGKTVEKYLPAAESAAGKKYRENERIERIERIERADDAPAPSKQSPAPGRIVYHFKRSNRKSSEKTPKYQGTYVKGADGKRKAAEKLSPDNIATKQLDQVGAALPDRAAGLDKLMKEYLSEDEYKSYLKRHGGAKPAEPKESDSPAGDDAASGQAVDEKHFEAAMKQPAIDPSAAQELSERERAEIAAETAELSQEDIDIKKRIRDAEDYVRSITDQPPITEREGVNDFDETDVNLMIAFGMDDELASTVGIDRVNQIEANLARESVHYEEVSESGEKQVKKAFEFTSGEQTKGIFRRYKTSYQKLLVRLLICTIMLVAAFIYENVGLFGSELPAPFNSAVYPITNIMLDLQLVAVCGMLVWRELAAGTAALFKLKPTPSSVLAAVLALTFVYDLIMCFTGIRPDGIILYGFPAILCVFLSLVGEFYNLRREIFSFNIAASKRVKFAVDRLAPEDAALETEAFGEYMPEQPAIFRVSRVSFIDNFYRRTAGYSRNKAVIGAIIPLIVIIAAIFFVAGYYVTKDAVDSLATAYLALMMCMPASVFLLYSYPMFKASAAAYELESAIIGEASVDEYTSASAISFDDKDVFPSTGVKVRSVKVYGNNRIDQVIYNAASIFGAAGGSLADVFDIATIDLGRSNDVEILEVEADGLEATVSGVHIYLGRAPYLRRNSFVPVRDVDDEELENGGEVCIMYMVCGDEVAAKMYVQYHIDPDFEFILKQLYSAGVCVGIKTSDPNIDDRMMGMRVKLDKYPVKVLKCKNVNEQNETKPRVDSGIVSKSSVKALLQTLALCDKVQHITKTNIVIKLFAILIGILLSAFLLALGLSAGVMSFYVALYQLFWILPMIIISKLFIG